MAIPPIPSRPIPDQPARLEPAASTGTVPFLPCVAGFRAETAGSPEEGILETVQYPLTSILYFESGNWALSDGSTILSEEESPVLGGPKYYVDGGETITGSGSVTVSGIPFSNFVPGTFTIQPTDRRVRDPNIFQITYKVIPWQDSGAPRLSLENAARFPDTRVFRPSRVQTLKVEEHRTAPATGIRADLDPNLSDFQVRIPAVRALTPENLTVRFVSVRPRKVSGAPLFSSGATLHRFSTELSGQGTRDIVAPRFPRGIF